MEKPLLAALVVLLQNIHVAQVQSQTTPNSSRCTGTANYLDDSLYETNLGNLLLQLKSVPSTVTGGFYRTAISGVNGLDVIYGLAQCRGDVDRISCASCLNRSVEEVFHSCKGCREAAILSDFCLLRFNSSRFYGTVDAREMETSYIANTSADPETFERRLVKVMGFTINIAAQENSRFASRIKSFSDSTEIYAQAECTRDLSTESCIKCLTLLLQNHQTESLAGGVRAASCTMRYAATPFISHSSLHRSRRLMSFDPPSRIFSPPSLMESKSDRFRTIIIIFSVWGSLALLDFFLIFCLLIRKWFSTRQDESGRTADAFEFKFDVLRAATGNFCEENKLGQGGFGPVYRGLLPDERQIAVKRLARTSAQGLNELKNEVLLMSKLFHRNLARFLGFCFEGEEKIVIYEYLPNRSLDKFLFDPELRSQLSWETRFDMIKGIARGLLYLHDDSRLRIIHRDLKASNILLDGDMNPKISDFGLARLFPIDETHVSTSHIAGTQGYMAPEYIFDGQFSSKSDVFSFGVLVLEIVTGRRNSGLRGSVIDYVWDHWVQGTVVEAVDQSVEIKASMLEAVRCIHVGLLCIQTEPRSRPSMSDVCLMLNSFLVPLQAPARPSIPMIDLVQRDGGDWDPLANVVSHHGTPSSEVSIVHIVPR